MKTHANISLDAPGIVLFDPRTLAEYLRALGVETHEVFDHFLAHQDVGNEAIRQGVIFPLYPIPADDYSVFLEEAPSGPRATRHFTYAGAPLHVTSGLLIAADLNAVMHWEPEFFGAYLEHHQDRLMNNDSLDVAPGRYLAAISGFSGLEAPLHVLGYGLRLHPVERFAERLPTEDFDFSVTPAPHGAP
ncbi:hypothetical protein LXT21_34810 [Myxococcus sp. K38C18041901]|uniref:hypothetical protein n=1 Tax=Myxococcus guangdongensis TaxID=2906760 RepID=UPI0020A823E3|nr:hypothetical protein [Myxococcus guangdongensis]MCP3063959.1 hypothetical protein [Myxococcus guangdongensis]